MKVASLKWRGNVREGEGARTPEERERVSCRRNVSPPRWNIIFHLYIKQTTQIEVVPNKIIEFMLRTVQHAIALVVNYLV